MNNFRGIDVSEHQGTIDWAAVKAAGIEFVIVRAGYGQNYIDKFADANVQGAAAQGLRIGLYWFSYPDRNPDTAAEGRYAAAFAAKYKDVITLPIFYDLEEGHEGPTHTWEVVQRCATNFCEAVKAAGWKTGVYYNKYYNDTYYGKYWEYHPDYFRWLAYPDSGPTSEVRDCWQYSFQGNVSGIAGAVDLDYWQSAWPGPGPDPKPPAEKYRWYAKPKFGYDRTSKEAQNNAVMIYRALHKVGWARNAVAGTLGNIEMESQYNPWRWQSDVIGTPSSGSGYGLFQYTPANWYIGNSIAKSFPGYSPNYQGMTGTPEDGNAQVLYTDRRGPEFWRPSSGYGLSWDQFKQGGTNPGGSSPEDMASAFLYNFEKPADPGATEQQRRQAARYWYGFLETIDPDGPGPEPEPTPIDLLDLIILTANKAKRRLYYCE